MAELISVRVFISYSHDSDEHRKRVLALASRLRSDGIDAQIDQYETSPPEGWPRWMNSQVNKANFVLAIVTETYSLRMLGQEAQGKGRGADWEGLLITQEIYEQKANTKFIPVVFSSEDEKHIPRFLGGVTRYIVESEGGYKELYRHLTSQPSVVPPTIGSVLSLPCEQLPGDFAWVPNADLPAPKSVVKHNRDTQRSIERMMDRWRNLSPRRLTGHDELAELHRVIRRLAGGATIPMQQRIQIFERNQDCFTAIVREKGRTTTIVGYLVLYPLLSNACDKQSLVSGQGSNLTAKDIAAPHGRARGCHIGFVLGYGPDARGYLIWTLKEKIRDLKRQDGEFWIITRPTTEEALNYVKTEGFVRIRDGNEPVVDDVCFKIENHDIASTPDTDSRRIE